MDKQVEELVRGHRDAVSVKRVFGEPYQRDGVTVIPAAKVFGGGGGGGGESADGGSQGSGTGYGLVATPAGAYVIRGDRVSWRPAIDANRIVAGIFVIAALAIVAGRGRS